MSSSSSGFSSPLQNHASEAHSSSTIEYDFAENGNSNIIPNGTYKLNFGSNFLSNKNDSQYHILKFDIKPPIARGNSYIQFDSNDSMKLTIPTDEPENNATYKGPVSHIKNGKECILFFDGESLRIEKVASSIGAKHIRCDKGDEDDDMKIPNVSHSNSSSSTIPPPPSSTAILTKPIFKPLSDADDEVSEREESSDDDDEQMLLEQIASSTQPPSNPELPSIAKSNISNQSAPIYTPSSSLQPSPPRTNSSASYLHPSPAISIPTPSSKNSSLLEDLMMSDSSESSSSDSDSDEEPNISNSVESKKNAVESMDYMMSNQKPTIPTFTPFEVFQNSSSATSNNYNNYSNLLSSDLQLSESSSDEDD